MRNGGFDGELDTVLYQINLLLETIFIDEANLFIFLFVCVILKELDVVCLCTRIRQKFVIIIKDMTQNLVIRIDIIN